MMCFYIQIKEAIHKFKKYGFFGSGNQLKHTSSALNYYLYKQKLQPLHKQLCQF